MAWILDTHVLIQWHGSPDLLSTAQRAVVEAADAEEPLRVSNVSLWEIATLLSLGRIELNRPLREWFELATAPPLVRLLPITIPVATEVAALPDSFHRDPSDRAIVATARVHGLSLVTSDERIIRSGLVRVVT